MRVRVPQDCSTLAEALARGADSIVIRGEVALSAGGAGVLLDRPVQITGGILRATGGWALVIGADVVLAGCRIENPDGHGVRIVAGRPTLSHVEIDVSGVAGVCEGRSRPVLRRVVVVGSGNGWLMREDCVPDGDELAVKASGSALVLTDRAAGHLARVALMSGDEFACVEARGQATTRLAGLTVLSAGCGALHCFEDSAITVDGGHIQRSATSSDRFPAVEARERSAPVLRELRIDNSGGRAVYLHGECRPVLRAVQLHRCGEAGLEVGGDVVLEVDGLAVTDAGGAGVVVRGQVTGRLTDLRTSSTGGVGLGLGGQSRLQVDGVQIGEAKGPGLRVAGSARATVRSLSLAQLDELGVHLCEDAAATLVAPQVRLGGSDGIHASDRARLIVRGGDVTDHQGHGVVASGEAQVRLERTRVAGNHSSQLLARQGARVRLVGCRPEGVIEREDAAEVLEDAPTGAG